MSEERLSGSMREFAEEKVREVQPATIAETCCATCGLRAYGSFLSGPPLCRCPLNTQPRVTVLYRLVAVGDASLSDPNPSRGGSSPQPGAEGVSSESALQVKLDEVSQERDRAIRYGESVYRVEFLIRAQRDALRQQLRDAGLVPVDKDVPFAPDRDEVTRELRQERDRLREALAELVRLKDGPRDDAYRAAKDEAWREARAALAQSQGVPVQGGGEGR